MVIDNDLTRKAPGQGYGSAKLYILYTYIHPSTLSFWSQVNTFYHSDTPPPSPCHSQYRGNIYNEYKFTNDISSR